MGFASIFRGRKLKELGPQQISAKGLLTESTDLQLAKHTQGAVSLRTPHHFL
jgi:hypothetical protein